MSIFTGMSKTLQKSIKPKGAESPTKPAVVQNIFPVLSAQSLLSSEKRQALLRSLKLNSGLPKSYFDSLYLEAVYNFAEFIQNLPDVKNGPYAYMGGLLDHGLERATMALTLCRAYIHPGSGNKDEDIEFSQQETLWIYAVFTAALIMEIGKVIDKYSIVICEKDGKTVNAWLPYASSMPQQGNYYKFEYEDKNRDYLRIKTTTALGWRILPAAGFNWISSDKDLLEQWFAMLDENTRTVGAMMTIIKRAEAQVLAKHFNLHELEATNANFAELLKIELDTEADKKNAEEEQKDKQEKQEQAEKSKDKSSTIGNKPNQAIHNPGSPASGATGIALLNWIRKGLENGTISVNTPDSFIHSVQDGILVLPEMFKQYTQQNTQFAWQNIYKIFTQFMGVTGTTNEMAYRYFAEQQRAKNGNGLVIKNPYILFPNGQIPPINKNITITTSTPVTGYDMQARSEKQTPKPNLQLK